MGIGEDGAEDLAKAAAKAGLFGPLSAQGRARQAIVDAGGER